jgi:UDP-glucose 4-epimerase
MRTLVTGGAGFIGSTIVRLLLAEGHDVAVLDNFMSGFRCNLEPYPEVRLVEGDVRNADDVSQAVVGAEVIFHLAASVGNTRSIENPIEDSEINVLGTLRILEAARRHNVRKVIFSSSAGIFGELKTLPIREDHPAEPDSPYGVSKLAGEKMCLAYNKLYDLEVACLRYFNVYGVNQRYDAYGNAIPIFAHQMLQGKPVTVFDDGEQTRDFANVQDVAQANYKAALAEGISGVFNVGSGTRISINQLVKLMQDVSESKSVVTYGPPRKGDVRDSLADISAARDALGFEPVVRLEEGLAEYIVWAKQEMVRQSCES